MSNDGVIIEMLNSLIDRIKIVVNDKTKQSGFGSLEYLLRDVIKYRDEKAYLKSSYCLLITPRWMGECVITPEEVDVDNQVRKINLYVAEEYHGGWDKQNSKKLV